MKFSVVTPSYNQGQFIARTLDSVAAQQGVELEHFVCDAASRDETVGILRSRGDAVRWVSEPDRGQAHAVNKAIAATHGDIIAWLNSDDVYYADALARVAACFAANPDADVVYGDAEHIGLDDRAFERYPTTPFDAARLARECFICQPAAFFRRRTVERYGALDESLQYCMDYELWLRLARAGAKFVYLPEILAGSRLYADNKTLAARLAVHAEINDMLRRTLGYVPLRWLVNYSYAAADAGRTAGQRYGFLRRARAAGHLIRAIWHWRQPGS